ncbi:hypothetical protein DFH27DRAFT_577895 [Peziza echinospora]|nr:hypothetical protein DFH27DRAFT_577895 [Peziza echinospora]
MSTSNPPQQRVFTYHCAFCSHLLLATTLHLPSLPRRQSPGLDNAIIAPLPPPPRNPDDSDSDSETHQSSESESSESESEAEAPTSPPPPSNTNPASTPTTTTTATSTSTIPPLRKRKPKPPKTYTLLLSSIRDRYPKIIVRPDGFEKRYSWRCGRCKVVYSYQLDETQYPDPPTPAPTTSGKGKEKEKEKDDDEEEGGRGGTGGNNKKRRRRRGNKDYVYFLPGALMPTEELGREVGEKEAGFRGLEEQS